MRAGITADVYRKLIIKYGLQCKDALMLWDTIRHDVEQAERNGFKDGFQMAYTTDSIEGKEVLTIADAVKSAPSVAHSSRIDGGAHAIESLQDDKSAYARIELSKNGKQLHFNNVAAEMFGKNTKADIFIDDGNLIIYPTKDGRYTVSRISRTGQAQICCAGIIDKLVSGAGNYTAEKHDNHIVIRCAR